MSPRASIGTSNATLARVMTPDGREAAGMSVPAAPAVYGLFGPPEPTLSLKYAGPNPIAVWPRFSSCTSAITRTLPGDPVALATLNTVSATGPDTNRWPTWLVTGVTVTVGVVVVVGLTV